MLLSAYKNLGIDVFDNVACAWDEYILPEMQTMVAQSAREVRNCHCELKVSTQADRLPSLFQLSCAAARNNPQFVTCYAHKRSKFRNKKHVAGAIVRRACRSYSSNNSQRSSRRRRLSIYKEEIRSDELKLYEQLISFGGMLR